MKAIFISLFIFSSICLNVQAWIQKTSMFCPFALDGPIGFSIADNLYVEGGLGSSSCQMGFYQYDQATNTRLTKAGFPIGLPSYWDVINGKIYKVCGIAD